MARYDENFDVCVFRADSSRQIGAVHSGHKVVRYEHIGPQAPPQLIDCFFTGSGLDDDVSELAQHRGRARTHQLLIVNQQHDAGRTLWRRLDCAGYDGPRRVAGGRKP